MQVSIGKQWKDVLDYNEKLGYLVHVSDIVTRYSVVLVSSSSDGMERCI